LGALRAEALLDGQPTSLPLSGRSVTVPRAFDLRIVELQPAPCWTTAQPAHLGIDILV
jgi:hypothetical protein